MCRFLIYLDVEFERYKDKELFAWIREAIAIPAEIGLDSAARISIAEVEFKTLLHNDIPLIKTRPVFKQFGSSNV